MNSNYGNDDFKYSGPSSSGSSTKIVAKITHEQQLEVIQKPSDNRFKAAGAAAGVVELVGAEAAIINKEKQQQVEEDSEERIDFKRLMVNGVTESDLERLRKSGFCTVEAVAFASIRQLCKIQGVSEKKAEKLIENANALVPITFCTASMLHEKRLNVISITTGSKNLDTLLQGGFETGTLTEIFGENNAGKTQICKTLAVTCQLSVDEGGAEGKCLYIDTEGTFRAERLLPIAERYGLVGRTVLDNVVYARCFNTEQQLELLNKASDMMSEQRFALVVVDSSTALFRAEFVGRGELFERQSLLGKFLHNLRRISDQHGVAVVYTNQVVSDVSGLSVFTGNLTKPIGGNIMGHASTTRLQVRKGRGANRICKVYSSAIIPESEAEFQITAGGINDPVD